VPNGQNSEKRSFGGKNFRRKCFCGPSAAGRCVAGSPLQALCFRVLGLFAWSGIDLMKTFRLPCECSHAIVVTTGQAGGVVNCPACGREVAVPKLRDFSQLEVVEARTGTPRTGWRLAHACMLAGGVTAVLAWVAAAVLSVSPQATITAETIRANVAAASDKQIFEAWKALSQSVVARPPLPEEKRLQQRSHFWQGVSRGLLVIGAVGVLVGLAGVGMWSAGRGQQR
jgi:hypothetical protein